MQTATQNDVNKVGIILSNCSSFLAIWTLLGQDGLGLVVVDGFWPFFHSVPEFRLGSSLPLSSFMLMDITWSHKSSVFSLL